MNIYTLTEADLTSYANQAKDLILQSLEDTGHIVSAQAVGEEFVIVVFQKGWLGKFFDRLMKTEEDGTKLQVFRVVRRPSPPSTPDE